MTEGNPYSPPEADSASAPRVFPHPRRMPGTVIAALILIVLLLGLILAGDAMMDDAPSKPSMVVPILVTLALVVGLLLAHPMAWSISRSLAIVIPCIALGLLALSLLFVTPYSVVLAALAFLPSAGLNLAIYLLLTRPVSRAWFGLGCPRCGSLYPHSLKFGYGLARCRVCHTQWAPRTGAMMAF